MDSLITAAARALAAGDPFGALNRVALRDDAPALALRGIAMAQIGDLARAKVLLRRAVRAFGAKEAVARARCRIAEAEIAFVSRDLGQPMKVLESARSTLYAHGDIVNAAHARYLQIRRLLLIGHIDEAERMLGTMDRAALPPVLQVIHEMAAAGIAVRRVHAAEARAAFARAENAADGAAIPALMAEVRNARLLLDAPAARLVTHGTERLLSLDEIEALTVSGTIVVDVCRYTVRNRRIEVHLAKRPVLFTLARALGEAWPGDVPRDRLILHAFRLKTADESLRVRLRVEMGRLRQLLRGMADVKATASGYALISETDCEVAVLAHPVENRHAMLLALLADGESWSSSALALALGNSQRSTQRALESLAAQGEVQSYGRGRAQRWVVRSVPGFPTTLLLPAPLPGD